MDNHRFTAFALVGELDLNRLGNSLGIARKYRWEEPMILNPVTLQPLSSGHSEERQVYLHFFGGVVFLDCEEKIIREFGLAMGKVTDAFKGFPNIKYQDDYSLRIESGSPLTITNDYAVVPNNDRAFKDIIAFVLAKSVEQGAG